MNTPLKTIKLPQAKRARPRSPKKKLKNKNPTEKYYTKKQNKTHMPRLALDEPKDQ